MRRSTPTKIGTDDPRIEEMSPVPGWKDYEVRLDDHNILWVMDYKQGCWLPFATEWKICPNCRGNGTMVNPSIDGHGLSAEDFAEDPDFAESYFRGDYDIACPECEGGKKRWTSDPEGLRLLQEHAREAAAARAEIAAERRMGC